MNLEGKETYLEYFTLPELKLKYLCLQHHNKSKGTFKCYNIIITYLNTTFLRFKIFTKQTKT